MIHTVTSFLMSLFSCTIVLGDEPYMFFASRLSLLRGKGFYHIQECFHFINIKDKNLVLIRNEKEAQAEGYTKCSYCCKLLQKQKLQEKMKKEKPCDESKFQSDEYFLNKYSGKYKFSYKVLGNHVIIGTRYSEWYYERNNNEYKLYHRNTTSKGSGKWINEFHRQSHHSRFSALSALLKYIYNHDLRKYKKMATKSEI